MGTIIAHADFPCFFLFVFYDFVDFTMLVSILECGCASIAHDNNSIMYETKGKILNGGERPSLTRTHTHTNQMEGKNPESV